jgi:alcohol dehydrogenase class IV
MFLFRYVHVRQSARFSLLLMLLVDRYACMHECIARRFLVASQTEVKLRLYKHKNKLENNINIEQSLSQLIVNSNHRDTLIAHADGHDVSTFTNSMHDECSPFEN